MAGLVVNVINGERYDKPGEKIDDGTELKLKGEKLKYVSRGGLKLEKALQVFEISVDGQTTIDIGASTGGFTDVMLQMVQNLSMRLMLVPINWFGNFVRMNVFVAWSSIISAMQIGGFYRRSTNFC